LSWSPYLPELAFVTCYEHLRNMRQVEEAKVLHE